MPAATFKEKAVVEIWQRYLTGRTDLVTEDGRSIRVVYPGMVNGDRGADFVDAVILSGHRLLRGSVEIHVSSSGWWGHGHHADPAYNGVILHVVYRKDREKAVQLENGKSVPTLVLDRFVDGLFDGGGSAGYRTILAAMPCHDIVCQRNGARLGEILDTAGEARFLARVADFREKLNNTEAGQTLYEGIMESLGYTKNKGQMKTLAGLLPLAKLENLIAADSADADCLYRLQALLLGTAGLLTYRRCNKIRPIKPLSPWLNKLETFWAAWGEEPRMSGQDWNYFKVRPGNYPTRRLLAMAGLLFRYRKGGILEGLADDIGPDYRSIEESLYVAAAGYGEATALLGRERAAAIAVNVLLPLAAARSELESQAETCRRILEIFRQYPRLTTNNLEKHMNHQLGIDRGRVNSARRQQGLIHIYRTLCSQGECRLCPLNTS